MSAEELLEELEQAGVVFKLQGERVLCDLPLGFDEDSLGCCGRCGSR